jgi:MFS family permease
MTESKLRVFRSRRGAWRNHDFVSVWSAATVSQVGSQVSLLGLPFIAILTLRATTFEVAALGIADVAPLLLFGLPAGVWLDRIRRRPMMIVGDVGRAIALASIPCAYAAGVLTIWQLYGVGFLTGTLTVLFDVASVSVLPAIVAREDLPGANAALQVSGQSAQVAGPGIPGFLVALLGAPYAIAVDAASYLGSAAFVSRIKAEENVVPKEQRRPMSSEIREGLVYVLRHPILRPIVAFTSTANLFNSILFAVALLFAVRQLGLSARQVGLVFMLSNVGSLLGAAATPKLQRRFGLGRVMLVGAFSGWALLLLPFAAGAWRIPMLVGGLLIWGTAAVIWNATSAAIGQATTPARLMSRVAATRRLLAWGAMPAGTLAGGLLGTYLGLRTTMFIGAGGRAVAGLIVLTSPLRSIRTMEDADAIAASLNESVMVRDLALNVSES